ncbi:MAG: winged helix family transcriptional regulator [Haliscomenobacteraceae bacterium CHB4]|nr:hypothetical protein [Saprospiraceae bacterium]MCE7926098.1 winged helix family transcriptional regulator [Haliscomenobacteraceae bacterium CHB4]
MGFTLTFGRMSRTLNINLFAVALLAAAGLLAMQAVEQRNSEVGERQFSEQVNLALRQAAHRLLVLAGDRSSHIPPVEQLEENTWLIRLEHNFDYDSLPPVLQESFAWYRVSGDYQVAVLDCSSDALMLGYTASLLTAGKEIPCGGREQSAGCYNLKVTFPGRASTTGRGAAHRNYYAAIFLALLIYPVYRGIDFWKKKGLDKAILREDNGGAAEMAAMQETNDGMKPFKFGRSVFHVDNQKLIANGIEKNLTYRETKLLQLFCRHPNQLLERDHILKAVWEDEGVIVGRSVDVFVSRLRKLLKDDQSVQIINVHGVGYRLEVKVSEGY